MRRLGDKHHHRRSWSLLSSAPVTASAAVLLSVCLFVSVLRTEPRTSVLHHNTAVFDSVLRQGLAKPLRSPAWLELESSARLPGAGLQVCTSTPQQGSWRPQGQVPLHGGMLGVPRPAVGVPRPAGRIHHVCAQMPQNINSGSSNTETVFTGLTVMKQDEFLQLNRLKNSTRML